jgi:hypothetical protein
MVEDRLRSTLREYCVVESHNGAIQQPEVQYIHNVQIGRSNYLSGKRVGARTFAWPDNIARILVFDM